MDTSYVHSGRTNGIWFVVWRSLPILFFVSMLCPLENTMAQTSTLSGAAKRKIQILHRPPHVRDLPDPGRPLKFVVSLSNTRNTSLVLRMLVVADDEFEDLAFRNAYLNEYDQPTYEVEFPSPLVDMQYQLLLVDDAGAIIPSPAYQIARACLPNTETIDLTNDSNLALKDRAPLLVERAAKLEKELTAYDAALKLASELQEMVKAE